MRVVPPISLDAEQRKTLELQARARSLPARVVERVQIVLRAADGFQDKAIAAGWASNPRRSRAGEWFLKGGLAALRKDASVRASRVRFPNPR